MIYNLKYSNYTDRSEVISYLASKSFTRVLDIGATMNGWSASYISHYMDINPWKESPCEGFIGNICLLSTWEPLLEDVKQNGLFDFVICSHTLEDISSPQFVSEMICRIGKEGFIAVPSKNEELRRGVNGEFYGHIHHRWIYNIENDEFIAYPKLNLIEKKDYSETIKQIDPALNEISFFWKDEYPFKIVNNDYMGPNTEAVHGYFEGLRKE